MIRIRNIVLRTKKCIERSSAVRFLISGGVSTAFDFSIYTLLCRLTPFSADTAKLCSVLSAAGLSYCFSRSFTFRSSCGTGTRGKDRILEVLRYSAAQAVNIFFNTLVHHTVYSFTSDLLTSFVSATGGAMCINYVLQRLWVFRKGKFTSDQKEEQQ